MVVLNALLHYPPIADVQGVRAAIVWIPPAVAKTVLVEFCNGVRSSGGGNGRTNQPPPDQRHFIGGLS